MDKKDDKPKDASAPQTDQSEGDINSLENLSEGNDKTEATTEEATPDVAAPKPKKKGFKRILGFFNVYLVAFIFLLVVGGAVFTVYYLNSKKTPKTPEIAVEDLSEETLNQVANQGEATIGSSDLLLNFQSNAVFNGQILAKGDVNIAGDLKLGRALNIPSLIVSDTSNLGNAQINQLSVANSMVVAGSLTVQQGLSVGGTTTLAALTASRISTGTLVLSGTGALELNNHIIVNGPNPSRSTGGAVGSGGSASVSGSDTNGRVNINTGQGTNSGCFITVNFTQRYGTAPTVNLTPASAGASNTRFYATSTPTSFSVCAGSPAPTGSNLDFYYFVVE
ncbi:MAG TPA: hypothetical protein VD735_00190 [Candidatus Saccharimonadales bacterium]|nr:hypothetical protein [Candidatus Saccharimonadales bacterium]